MSFEHRFLALEEKYSIPEFPITLKRAYHDSRPDKLRITMTHKGRVIQTVEGVDQIGSVISVMRASLNSGNYCHHCGAVK